MANSKIRDFFCWTDDEVELLLKVTEEYKATKAVENTDWESSQTKYGDIFELYREQYPSQEEAITMRKEYPHHKDDITKVQLTSKLKAIRTRYRQAVDSGKKSGHGRVILLFFELCGSIWGGSPATDAISEDIETGGVAAGGVVAGAVKSIASLPDTPSSSMPDGDGVAEDAVSAEVVASRRQGLDATLSGHRRDKLKRKFSADSVAQEDLSIKRRLLQRLEATDNEFVQTTGRWSSTMDHLNSSIEQLVQHIVGSGTSHRMTPGSPRNTHQATSSFVTQVDPVTLDGPSSPRGLSPSRSSTDLEQFEVPSDGCGDCGECDGCSLGFKPQTSRKRKCVEDPDYLKPFNNHMEQHKVDAYDRYAQTVADFMRGLSRRRCIIFKKRVNDLMYEMDLAELEDFTQS